MPDVFHGVFCDVILRFKHLQFIEGHIVIKASINLPLEYLNCTENNSKHRVSSPAEISLSIL